MKVVSLGMYPAVAEYNQFYTLDSYVYSYPLAYKHQFREVIATELEKSRSLCNSFDKWGSRCYLCSAELGKHWLYDKRNHASVNHLELNTTALKKLGCMYIISAVDIKNNKDIGLSLINSYTSPQSYWNIRVYKLL